MFNLFTSKSKIENIHDIRIMVAISKEAKPMSVVASEIGGTDSATGKALNRLSKWITKRKFKDIDGKYKKYHNPPKYEFILNSRGKKQLEKELSCK